MKRIAIVGNIASGKSEVEKIIQNLGYMTICADNIVHKLYTKPDIQEKIYKKFGTIEREELSSIVFNDTNERKKLEQILHPCVKDEINNFFINNKNDKLLFAVVPLLFEASMENMFDIIIFISSDEKIRLKRIINRNKISEKDAQKRINSQIDEKIKIKKSDYVIENNADLKNLETKIVDIIEKIKLL